jgi:hypothetical protein
MAGVLKKRGITICQSRRVSERRLHQRACVYFCCCTVYGGALLLFQPPNNTRRRCSSAERTRVVGTPYAFHTQPFYFGACIIWAPAHQSRGRTHTTGCCFWHRSRINISRRGAILAPLAPASQNKFYWAGHACVECARTPRSHLCVRDSCLCFFMVTKGQQKSDPSQIYKQEAINLVNLKFLKLLRKSKVCRQNLKLWLRVGIAKNGSNLYSKIVSRNLRHTLHHIHQNKFGIRY